MAPFPGFLPLFPSPFCLYIRELSCYYMHKEWFTLIYSFGFSLRTTGNVHPRCVPAQTPHLDASINFITLLLRHRREADVVASTIDGWVNEPRLWPVHINVRLVNPKVLSPSPTTREHEGWTTLTWEDKHPPVRLFCVRV